MNATTARKIWGLLTSAERRSAVVLLGLMCIGMVQTQSTPCTLHAINAMDAMTQ